MAKRSSKRNAKANAARRMGDRDGSASSAKPYVPLADLKRGRDHGDAMLYDPNQEYNYKSGEIRYGNAIGLASQVMRSPDGLFRVPSSGRSDKGYWSPGQARMWCNVELGRPYGMILEVPSSDGTIEFVIKVPTNETVILWLWTGEPDCNLLGGGAEMMEMEAKIPDEETLTVTYSLDIAGLHYWSISQGFFGSTGLGRFLAFRVNNFQPGSIALETEPPAP